MSVDFKPVIQTKRGRYGGTYAHPVVAMKFAIDSHPKLEVFLLNELYNLKPDIMNDVIQFLRDNPIEERDSSGYIYLLNEVGSTKYKIGMTKNLNKRIKSHKCSNSSELKYIAYKRVETALREETKLHALLSDYKISGEWYNIEDATIQHIINAYFT
jgi:predicted GIY-YIG superfamily endonuclease